MSEHKIETFGKFEAFVQAILKASGKTSINWSKGGPAYYDVVGGEPNAENFWVWRELLRTYDLPALKDIFKAYIPTVFDEEPWVNKLHFVHVSQDDNAMLAYTPDAEKGRRDVRIKTTVGKYLTKYHMGDLKAAVTPAEVNKFRTDMATKAAGVSGALRKVKDYTDTPDDEIRGILATEVIKKWADKHREKLEEGTVLFASTREECAEVYLNGPSSCMDASHKATYTDNTGGIHPAEMYASPDIVIAYTRRNGKINARVVCHIGVNPPRYTRVYGDATIATRLQELGFVESYNTSGALGLDGARLLKERSPKNAEHYIVPYLDAPAQHLRMERDYLVISKRATESPGTTQYGAVYVEDSSTHVACSCCGSLFRPSNLTTVHGAEPVCVSCLETNYTYAMMDARGTEAYVATADTVVAGTRRYHRDVDLPALGFVQLRNETWVKTANARPHYLGGFIKQSSQAILCGTANGHAVYAEASEINGDWELEGGDYAKVVRPPAAGHDTVRQYVERMIDVSYTVRNRDQTWSLLVALLQHTGAWVDANLYDLFSKAWEDYVATPVAKAA